MNANPEIDTLLQEVLALQSRDDLNHHEKIALKDKKILLLEETYKAVFKENEDRDSELYWKAFEEALKKYCKNNKHNFVADTKKLYKLKCRGKIAEALEEKDPEEAKIRKKEIRETLRSIAKKHGMASKDITAALKFNMLNSQRVHQFLVSNFRYSEEELDEFDRTVFNRRFTYSFDANPEEGSAQNRTEAEASQANKIQLDYLYDNAFDYVLNTSYEFSMEQGKKYQQEMKGYWSIKFVKGNIKEEIAEKKEKHIIFEFYKNNLPLYEKYEKIIVFDESAGNEKKLHEKLIKVLHNELMPRMSVELKLQQDTWRKKYGNIDKYIWRVLNDIHLLSEEYVKKIS